MFFYIFIFSLNFPSFRGPHFVLSEIPSLPENRNIHIYIYADRVYKIKKHDTLQIDTIFIFRSAIITAFQACYERIDFDKFIRVIVQKIKTHKLIYI